MNHHPEGVPHATELMPRESRTQEILMQRAKQLAQLEDSAEDQQGSGQYLLFRLGVSERYGIAYDYLDELLYMTQITRVPCTPGYIAGVINHRGELLTVLDLQAFFKVEVMPLDDEARIVVVSDGDIRVGLLVHAVEGNEEFVSSKLAPPIESDGVKTLDYVLGINDSQVVMLNIRGILGDRSLRVNESANPDRRSAAIEG